MKFNKNSNGNVEVWTDAGVFAKAYPNSAVIENQFPESGKLQVTCEGRLLSEVAVEEVTATILEEAETPFNGTIYQLADILKNDFFFSKVSSGGGTDDYNDLENKPFTDDEVLRLKQMLNVDNVGE